MRTEKSAKGRATTAVVMLAMACAAALPRIASAETVLRIGMTAADIPRTLGQPDQGFEGNRFTGLTMYDALTMWDLSSADKASVMIPGLATGWAVADADTGFGPQGRRHDGGIDHYGAGQFPSHQSHQSFHGFSGKMAEIV